MTANPQKIGKGRWLVTFTPGRAGDYTASAWVSGESGWSAGARGYARDETRATVEITELAPGRATSRSSP